jgi:hypothetical protein
MNRTQLLLKRGKDPALAESYHQSHHNKLNAESIILGHNRPETQRAHTVPPSPKGVRVGGRVLQQRTDPK